LVEPGDANFCAMVAQTESCRTGDILDGSFVKLCNVCFQQPGELEAETIEDPVCCCLFPWVGNNYANFGVCVTEVTQALKQDPNFCLPPGFS
jgi:hypothetical protein